MEILDTKVILLRGDGALGFVSVEVDMGGHRMTFSSLQIRDGQYGLWVAWPGKRSDKDGKFYGNIFFHDMDDLKEINRVAIVAYEDAAKFKREPMARTRTVPGWFDRVDDLPLPPIDDDLPF